MQQRFFINHLPRCSQVHQVTHKKWGEEAKKNGRGTIWGQILQDSGGGHGPLHRGIC